MSGDFSDCYINFILKHLSGKCGSDILEWSTSGAICTIWLMPKSFVRYFTLYKVLRILLALGKFYVREHIEFRYPRDLF